MKKFQPQNFIAQLSVDCVIFGYKDKKLKVLISKIVFGNDFWSLPGGFILKNEGIDDAAKRVLQERTSLTDIFLEQFHVFGNTDRSDNDLFSKMPETDDNTFVEKGFSKNDFEWLSNRFVSIGYYALVDIDKVKPKKGELDDSVEWVEISELPKLIMDHNVIAQKALLALRQNLDQKLIGFNLLPDTFTMREVQELYEAIYDKPFPRNNFQKKILDLNVLDRLEKKFTGAANKAPYLYRFLR